MANGKKKKTKVLDGNSNNQLVSDMIIITLSQSHSLRWKVLYAVSAC